MNKSLIEHFLRKKSLSIPIRNYLLKRLLRKVPNTFFLFVTLCVVYCGRLNSGSIVTSNTVSLKAEPERKSFEPFCLPPPTTVVKFIMDSNLQGKPLAIRRDKKANRKH
jgi:hypothetical protein